MHEENNATIAAAVIPESDTAAEYEAPMDISAFVVSEGYTKSAETTDGFIEDMDAKGGKAMGTETPAETQAFEPETPIESQTAQDIQPPREKGTPEAAKCGISSLNELNNSEVMRAELASCVYKPKVILSYESISFNKACVNLLPDTLFVNVLIDRTKKRIIILPVNKHAKDALQWCGVSAKGEVKKKVCTARRFGEKLYDMMQWVKENKYRVLAYYQEIEGVRLLVFNLCEHEMVVPDFITTKTGKVVKRGRVYLPGEWEGGFGMSLVEHGKANEVELNANYTLSDKDVDVKITDVRIRGRVPTDEDIIRSRYRKEKPQEVLAGA